MDRIRYIKYYILFFILGGIFSLFIWDRFLTSDEIIEVRYDSIIYHIDSVKVPVPYETVKYTHTVTTDTLFLYDSIMLTPTIDSALILSDWLKTRYYKDTITNSDLSIYLNETVTQNRITDRDVSYQILRPETIIKKPVNSLYIGGYLYNSGVVPYAQYNRSNWSVSAGYDPINSKLFVGGGMKLYSW